MGSLATRRKSEGGGLAWPDVGRIVTTAVVSSVVAALATAAFAYWRVWPMVERHEAQLGSIEERQVDGRRLAEVEARLAALEMLPVSMAEIRTDVKWIREQMAREGRER